MNAVKLLAAVATIAVSLGWLTSQASAQARQATSRDHRAAAATSAVQSGAVQQKCLRALNGACTNPTSVEEARLRAVIIPASQVSYLGTPAGTFGGDYITYQRFFQDNPLLYGLPTFTLVTPCCITRSK